MVECKEVDWINQAQNSIQWLSTGGTGKNHITTSVSLAGLWTEKLIHPVTANVCVCRNTLFPILINLVDVGEPKYTKHALVGKPTYLITSIGQHKNEWNRWRRKASRMDSFSRLIKTEYYLYVTTNFISSFRLFIFLSANHDNTMPRSL